MVRTYSQNSTKTVCWNCGGEIEEYHNENYKGKRGRCHNCGVDFPFE